MRDRLPSLTALRAFEAAARHLSFSEAAAELHVTPAALSYQIKALEEALGTPLFLRGHRQVALTTEGRALAPGLAEGFGALHRAWAAVRRDPGRLSVTAGPGFLSAWLAPRMARFVEAHPEITLHLTASLAMLDFERDGIDLAIRFGPTDRDPGYASSVLFEDWATPMMTPELAAQVRQPADLLALPVITQHCVETLAGIESWQSWAEAVDFEMSAARGPVFTAPDAAIRYAATGGGVVLGRVSLAESYLASGQLVMPLAPAIRRGFFYRLVCPEARAADPGVQLFRDWLQSEIADLDRYAAGRSFV